MSTILKALKRLEHEKQAEVSRDLAHDPLAPAAAAAPKRRTSKRPPVWLAAAAAVAVVAGAASYGLASWWFSRDGQAGASNVAAAGRQAGGAPIAAAVPAESTRRASHEALARKPAPRAGIESVSSFSSSSSTTTTARSSSDSSSPVAVLSNSDPERAEIELAQAMGGDPDPWEQAAPRPPVAARPPAEAPVRASTVTDGASRTGGRRSETREPIPSRRPDAEPVVKGAIPVASLPVAELPDPWIDPQTQTQTKAEVDVVVDEARATKAVPEPLDRPTPRTVVAAAVPKDVPPVLPEPRSLSVVEASDRLDMVVVGTVWHPKPERRSAQLQLDDRIDLVEAREGDVIEGYLIREITPSSVVISRGKVIVTHRVGR